MAASRWDVGSPKHSGPEFPWCATGSAMVCEVLADALPSCKASIPEEDTGRSGDVLQFWRTQSTVANTAPDGSRPLAICRAIRSVHRLPNGGWVGVGARLGSRTASDCRSAQPPNRFARSLACRSRPPRTRVTSSSVWGMQVKRSPRCPSNRRSGRTASPGGLDTADDDVLPGVRSASAAPPL